MGTRSKRQPLRRTYMHSRHLDIAPSHPQWSRRLVEPDDAVGSRTAIKIGCTESGSGSPDPTGHAGLTDERWPVYAGRMDCVERGPGSIRSRRAAPGRSGEAEHAVFAACHENRKARPRAARSHADEWRDRPDEQDHEGEQPLQQKPPEYETCRMRHLSSAPRAMRVNTGLWSVPTVTRSPEVRSRTPEPLEF